VKPSQDKFLFSLRLKGYLHFSHHGKFAPTFPLWASEKKLLLPVNAFSILLYYMPLVFGLSREIFLRLAYDYSPALAMKILPMI
jgi:hypothetical protein